jgi:hypothetical protein
MCIELVKRSVTMNLAVEKKRKHLILTQSKVSLAKKILGTKTETETIEMALDSVISEAEKNRNQRCFWKFRRLIYVKTNCF